MFYKLQNSKVMIGGSQSCGTSNDNSCINLYDLIQDDDGGYLKNRKKKDKHLVTILAKLTVYYPLANEVVKGYSNATGLLSFRPSVTSLWTL